MNKLFFDKSIGELEDDMQKGLLSPTDVVSASIENVTELDSTYHAFVVSKNIEDIASTQTTGTLAGIPVGVKDIYNTADFPTQMGSPLWKDFTPGNDARAVYNLKKEGAVVIGKTVTAEFAVHALNETINPYDATRTPGTSSSGSAVAVSTGMVPLALGTQTAGSIIRPASFGGVYAMKPSFGLIPRTGMLKTTDTLDSLGFFTIHADDLGKGFDALHVRGKDYPLSNEALTDSERQSKPTGRPWKAGFVRTHTWDGAEEYVQEAVASFISKLGDTSGFDVVEVELPEGMKDTHAIHGTIYDKALSYYFQNEYKRAEDISPVMKAMIEKGERITPETYQKALDAQVSLINAMDGFLQDFDVVISIATSEVAPLRDVSEKPDPSLMWTLTHLPSITIPLFKNKAGLPFGLQVVSRKYNDYKLLSFLRDLTVRDLAPKKAGYFI